MALVGIYNENDFYSHHYLSEVFVGDIRGVLEQWLEKENQAREIERAEKSKVVNRSVAIVHLTLSWQVIAVSTFAS